MSQASELLNLFRMNGNRLTLGQILNTTLAAEYRARMTDLRHKGFQIDFIRGKKPSENLYILGGDNEGMGALDIVHSVGPKSQGESGKERVNSITPHERPDSPPIYFERETKQGQLNLGA